MLNINDVIITEKLVCNKYNRFNLTIGKCYMVLSRIFHDSEILVIDDLSNLQFINISYFTTIKDYKILQRKNKLNKILK